MMHRLCARVVLLLAPVLISTPASALDGWHSDLCTLEDGFALGSVDGLKPEQALWLGIYDGYWQHALSHTLIVAKIGPDGSATGFYAHGKYDRWRIYKPGCVSFEGVVNGDELTFTLGNGAKVTYTRDEDKLDGKYEVRGTITDGSFKRVSAPPEAGRTR